MTRFAALALAWTLVGAATSEALVLCQKRKGQVVARDACRKKETPVDLSALGTLGPQGTQGSPGAAGARGEHPLRAVDSAGAEMGDVAIFFPGASWLLISHPALGVPVYFLVNESGYEPNRAGAIAAVFYGSTDCSGIPFIKQQSEATLAQVYGDSAYFSTAPEASRSYGSYERDTGEPCEGGAVATTRGTCCTTASGTEGTQPAVRVALSTLGFVPPFTLEDR